MRLRAPQVVQLPGRGFLVAVAGCDVSFPDEYRIEDLRVLNLRADPPEIAIFERAPGGTLPIGPDNFPSLLDPSVHLSALVAHPDLEANLEVRWLACGPMSDLPCEGQAKDIKPSLTGTELDFRPVQVLGAALLSNTSTTSGPPAQALGSLLEDPRDLFNGLFAYVNTAVRVLDAKVPVDTAQLNAEKRIVIYDPRLIATAVNEAGKIDASAAAALGLPDLCTKVSDAQRDQIFSFLQTREPNHSPILAPLNVELTVGVTDTPTKSVARGQIVELRAGESIAMRPDVAYGSKESYKVLDGNCKFQDFEEKMVFSWFTVRGDLTRHTSTERTPVVEYTAPQADTLTTEVTNDRVWLVLRDGRGGSDHMWFDLHIIR